MDDQCPTQSEIKYQHHNELKQAGGHAGRAFIVAVDPFSPDTARLVLERRGAKRRKR